MPALVLEQLVDGQWQSPNRVVAWGYGYYGQTRVPEGLSDIVAVAAGNHHSVALKKDGRVVAWGSSYQGQTSVPAGLNSVVAIAAGDYHTAALKSDGSVVVWGYNGSRRISVPTDVSDVVAIAAGGEYTVALKSNGSVVFWGESGISHEALTTSLGNVIAIAAANDYLVALNSDGSIVGLGYNNTEVPVPRGLTDVVSIAVGDYHRVALKRDGTVVAWGGALNGQANVPAGLNNVVGIAANDWHTVALKSDGSAVAWGWNGYGQTTVPPGLIGVVAISAGGAHNVALTSIVEMENPVKGSSSNITLRLTNPSTTNSLTGLRLELPTSEEGQYSQASQMPTTLSPGASFQFTINYTTHTRTATSGMLQVFANGFALPLAATTLRVDNAQQSLLDLRGDPITDGASRRVIAWGDNNYGQTTVPSDLGEVAAISAGNDHTVALKSDGRVIAWGDSRHGQATVPSGLNSVVAIAAGAYHTAALKSDGRVVAWGNNYDGQATVPAELNSVVAIAAGGSHTMALKSDGRVVAWGNNGEGQTRVPSGLKSVVAIAAGGAHSLAIRSDGRVVAWGYNGKGQTRVPVGLKNVVAVAASDYHTVALKDDGSVFAWGSDFWHQTSSVPTAIPINVVAIQAGYDHTLLLNSGGYVGSWGYNPYRNTKVPVGLNGVVSISARSTHAVALVEAMNDFLPIQLGLNRDHTLYIKDTGAIALRGISLVIEGPDADQFSIPWLQKTHIAVGEQSAFALRFTPTRLGPLSATLKIYSNDPDSPFILPIRGTGHFVRATESNAGNSIFTYAPLRLERATGLMLQKLSFTNTSGVSLQGLRLVLSNLASGVTLYSSSAGKALGTFEVLYTKAIAPNETVTFDLVYHDPKRRATASIQPVIKAQALEEAVPTPGPVTGTNVPLLRVQKLAQGPALEWNSKAGSTYVVEYSDDAGKTWSSAVHRLTSRGTRLFWIDRGQPETFSKPVVGTRSYRVKRL